MGTGTRKIVQSLKQNLIDASNLSYFDLNAETQVIADASPVGLGAVLVQKKNNEYKVICYASRSLTAIERKYSQTEREALGLVWACERFHMYLIGHDFELLTDHRGHYSLYFHRNRNHVLELKGGCSECSLTSTLLGTYQDQRISQIHCHDYFPSRKTTIRKEN